MILKQKQKLIMIIDSSGNNPVVALREKEIKTIKKVRKNE
jgi:hypothetical protein